jgi:hypothetical protein
VPLQLHRGKHVKLEFANVTTETRAQQVQKAALANQVLMVLQENQVLMVNLVYQETTHQFQWIPMASAIHAHSDQEDQQDHLAHLVQLEHEEPQAEAVHQELMEKSEQLVIQAADQMANQDQWDPKENQAEMDPEAKLAQQDPKDPPEDQAQQALWDQQDQEAKMVVLDQAQAPQDQPVDQVNQVPVVNQAQLANQVAQAKMQHTALAHDATNIFSMLLLLCLVFYSTKVEAQLCK